MAIYPYTCDECNASFEVSKLMEHNKRAEACPECGHKVIEQDFSRKQFRGFVNRETDWCSGKPIVQLHPNHPDRMVRSKTQMEKVYRKNGISMETGHFVSKEAQTQATVPRKQRLPSSATKDAAYGGVKEEK